MGALTSKPYAFTARPWELKTVYSFDFFDTAAAKIRMDFRGEEVLRILPVFDFSLDEEFINDRVRFFYDSLVCQRVNKVYFSNKEGKFLPQSWQKAFHRIFYYYLREISEEKKGISLTSTLGKFFFNTTAVSGMSFFFRYFSNLGKGGKFLALSDFRKNYIFLGSLDNLSGDILFLGLNVRVILPILNLKLRRLSNKNVIRVLTLLCEQIDTFRFFSLGNTWNAFFRFLYANSPVYRYVLRAAAIINVLAHPFFYNIGALKNTSFVYFNIADISRMEAGYFDKRLVWDEEVFFKDITHNFLLGGFKVTLTSHPTKDINSANMILPVFTPWEDGLDFINLQGNKRTTVALPFTTGRTAIRSIPSVFFSLSYFFDIFFCKNYRDLCQPKLEFISFFLGNLRSYNPQFSFFGVYFSASRIFVISTFFTIERNIFLVDSLTRASKFLTLASSRFKNLTIYD